MCDRRGERAAPSNVRGGLWLSIAIERQRFNPEIAMWRSKTTEVPSKQTLISVISLNLAIVPNG
jgi:hypothetical protein